MFDGGENTGLLSWDTGDVSSIRRPARTTGRASSPSESETLSLSEREELPEIELPSLSELVVDPIDSRSKSPVCARYVHVLPLYSWKMVPSLAQCRLSDFDDAPMWPFTTQRQATIRPCPSGGGFPEG